MPRIRSLKPEFFHDRKLARTTSITARMLYAGLWGLADEHGRLNGDPAFIKGQVFPYDNVDIEAILDELIKGGRVQPYEFDGDPYLFLPKLEKHQRLEAAKVPSRLPAPPDPSEVAPPSAPIAEPRANESAPDANEPAPSAESSVLLYVAGSRGQVAGSREQGGAELPRRDDIEQVCELLRQRMIQNGCKEPAVTKAWRDAARLLLDRDQRPLNEVLYVLDWSQRDDFWAKNVHSLPTFREKYDRLRMGAQQQSQRGSPQSNADGFRALIQKFEAQRIGGAQ